MCSKIRRNKRATNHKDLEIFSIEMANDTMVVDEIIKRGFTKKIYLVYLNASILNSQEDKEGPIKESFQKEEE